MGYDSWITGIYNVYDGRFKVLEAQDNIRQLEKIIIDNLGANYLWDEEGCYKIELKDEYEGYSRSKVTGEVNSSEGSDE